MRHLIRFLIVVSVPSFLSAQKQVGDLTVIYNSVITRGEDLTKKINSTTAFYLKGNLSRSEVNSNQFSVVTIYDSKAGSGAILKEVNGQKLLIRVNQENWYQKNIRFANLKFNKTAETKTIAGYLCNQATTSTPEGHQVTVYYTREIVPLNKAYDPLFKNLDGLPLEYELSKGDTHVRYTMSSINLNPVPASKFDIPTSGYRELTYEESLKLNSQ